MSAEHKQRELDLMELIAKQGLELAALKKQLCTIQLEKIASERAELAKCSNNTKPKMSVQSAS